jgi:hypothetical protein
VCAALSTAWPRARCHTLLLARSAAQAASFIRFRWQDAATATRRAEEALLAARAEAADPAAFSPALAASNAAAATEAVEAVRGNVEAVVGPLATLEQRLGGEWALALRTRGQLPRRRVCWDVNARALWCTRQGRCARV